MYGIKPSDLEHLAHLHDAEITQVCFGPYDLQFNFSPSGNVLVQGRCELIDATGSIVNVWEGETHSGVFQFPGVLMTPVTDIQIDTEKSFVLKFANKMSLRVIDNSDQYESFSVGSWIV